jgi:serine/threonine protein kinase
MGIAHRDIKPDNILISVDTDSNKDNLKICDFGSAKYLPSHNINLTTHETINAKSSVTYISTRYFRSPELLYGN